MAEEKNLRRLPIVRCEGLHRLVGLVYGVQTAKKAGLAAAQRRAAAVVFEPEADAPYAASDPERRQLTDLLGVELDEQGGVKRVFARQDFYWERWDVEQDVAADEAGVAWYGYGIELPGIELGEMRRLDSVQEFAQSVFFRDVVFAGGAQFRAAVFGGKVRFDGAVFLGPAQFRGAKFMDKAWFSHVRLLNGISFRNASFEESFRIEDIVLLGGLRRPQLVDFSGTVAKTKILFSVADEEAEDFDELIVGLDRSLTPYMDEDDPDRGHIELLWAGCGRNHFKPGYGRLVLGLLNSNLDYFSCDDRGIKDVTLLWRGCPHKPVRDSYGSAGGKARLGKYLHELRIKRRILQDMNWGDLSDECYATIMDRQLLLRRLEAREAGGGARVRAWMRSLLEEIVYKRCFGWGVRLSNTIATVVGVVAAFWVLTYVLGFFNVYTEPIDPQSLGWVAKSLAYSLKSLLVIDVPGARGLFVFVGMAEAALGYILCTVFVAILARKFMRL